MEEQTLDTKLEILSEKMYFPELSKSKQYRTGRKQMTQILCILFLIICKSFPENLLLKANITTVKT
jgi:hypothetical protein